MRTRGFPAAVAVLAVQMLHGPLPAQAPERTPVLLDTDIGTDIDDPFALALILASPELELRGVTAVGSTPQNRALMLCRFLTMTGRRNTQVAAGAEPQPKREITTFHQYYYHPDVLFNRTTRPQTASAVDFLYGRLKGQQGRITIVATGPLTNLARLLTEKPDCKPWIKRIIVTGGSLRPGADPEPHLAADVPAAQTVFASGVPLTVVPLEATAGLKLDEAGVRRMFAPGTTLSLQVQTFYQLWDRQNPVLAAPLAVGLCLEEKFCDFEEMHVAVDDRGVTRAGKGKPNSRVAVKVRGEEFLKWYVERMAACVAPSDAPAKLVPRGNRPHRVHVAEDYETDIERRWWLVGKPELRDVPPGSNRATRGVLTHDFDDLLGNPKAMYTAVVFNPVPGPPMGKNTRLSFRYRLKGTDTLRVQIYSLSNGYHRHLVLTGLPEDRWQDAAVDMTVARRPDGTGGPLSEGERIDDIQFYTDPKADLLIDDVVLYDAATDDEKRPFPRTVLYTGWFDSGRQGEGQAWPGTFTIVPDKGFFRNAAGSVSDSDPRGPSIRLRMRGSRPLGEATELSFRYHLTGADSLFVALISDGGRKMSRVPMQSPVKDRWAEQTIDFTKTGPRGLSAGDAVEEIAFLLPKGAELLVDDVLLYVPGKR